MNASTDREMTVFWCKVAKPHYRQAFSVLLDMVLYPILDPAEMEKEREVILEELRATNDYPAQLADLLIDETLWPDQAMGRDVGGAPETVKAITLDDVRTYMERQYNPANTVVAVAGGITEAEVVELVGNATHPGSPARLWTGSRLSKAYRAGTYALTNDAPTSRTCAWDCRG